jgi:Uma2 family endonuclease
VLADLRGTGRFVISVQNPLVLGEHYPDLVLYREGVRGRVPEAWLVDLRAGVVEVHSGPHAGGYGAVRTYARGEVVRSATFAEVVAFGAEEVLPG